MPRLRISALLLSLVAMLLCVRLLAGEAAAPAEVQIAERLSVHLVDERGRASRVFVIPREGARDILFRHSVPAELKPYGSWALDIADPPRKLSARVALEGEMPFVLHWDGQFESEKLQPGRRYYYRVLLVREDGIVASKWASFVTRLAKPEPPPRLPRDSIRLYVIPSGAAYVMSVQTPSMRTALFPTLSGDVRAIWLERITLGLRAEATSNILFVYDTGPKDFAYSDVSLFTRFRVLGEPPRPPLLPSTPPYVTSSTPELPSDAYGASTNLEVGVRFFNTVLRGYGGQVLDHELLRTLEGLTATIHFDQALGPLRWLLAVEGGYSVFRGKALVASVQTALMYDHLPLVSPGIAARFLYLRGHSELDGMEGEPLNDGERINRVLFLGGILNFKL